MKNYKIVFRHDSKRLENGSLETSNYSYVLVEDVENVDLSEGECDITNSDGTEEKIEKKFLSSITPGSTMAAMFTGSKLVNMQDFKKATVDFFKERGVEVNLI